MRTHSSIINLRKRKKGGMDMFDRNRFKAQCVLKNMTLRDVAKELGINESTLYRKIQRDGDFTRDEINKLIMILDISNPEVIFFTDKLA